MASSTDSRSRSRSYDDSDPVDKHDFFTKSFGRKYERAFQGIDESKSVDSRKWGLNSAFIADLSRVPDGIDVKTLEAQSHLGIPINAEELAETYDGIKGLSQCSIKLQQPPGHFDATSGKWKPKNIPLPDLINPSGHPRVKPLFEKKVLGKIVRGGSQISFGRGLPPKQTIINNLRHRALVEMTIACQSISANIRGIQKYLKQFDAPAWRQLAPFFRNYAFCEVLADEALALASQAQQLHADKIIAAHNFSTIFRNRTKRLILPSDPVVQQTSHSHLATGFLPKITRQSQDNRRRGRGRGRGRGRSRGRGRGRSNRNRNRNRKAAPKGDKEDKSAKATPNY